MQAKRIRQLLVVALVAFGLAACSLPRGAGLQSEVLKVSKDAETGELDPQFQLELVTRRSLDRFDRWPSVGENGLGWIKRVQQPANRIIAPGDNVSIKIWTTEEEGLLTTSGQRFVEMNDIRIAPGGSVFLPYIGSVRISGMSPEHARETIETRYTDVVPSAQVQLSLVEGRQSTVSLVGGVASPGVYPLPDSDYTILSLLAQGGGVSAGLTNPRITLQRGSKRYATSVASLYDNTSYDTTLRGGDKVVVTAEDRYFLSLGAAGSEAVHTFGKDQVSALDAMAVIGGISDTRADPKGILILREYPASSLRRDDRGPQETRVVFALDLTTADGLFSAGKFRIRSKDLVYVTESPVTKAQTVFGLIGRVFGLANTASNL